MSPIRDSENKQARRRIGERTRSTIYHGRIFVTISVAALAIAAVVVGSAFGNIHGSAAQKFTVWTAAAVFLLTGVVTTRRIASHVAHAITTRTIPAAGVAVRFIISAAGYLVVIFGDLGVLNIPLGHLLLGGALTGVILGIAAQQSLGNVFAGFVLLLARPFAIGDHIRVRSGALGGAFDGIVLGVSLTYVTIQVDGGPLKIPNSGMLAAAVGPYRTPPLPETNTDGRRDALPVGDTKSTGQVATPTH